VDAPVKEATHGGDSSMFRNLLILLAIPTLSSCASGGTNLGDADVARGSSAYRVLAPPPETLSSQAVYHIAPFDTLTVSVFQEPDLSTSAGSPLQVDANGNVSLPLIGSLPAAGKTTDELSGAIASRLGAKYLKNPQVSVAVATSAPQTVTVQGEVTHPGVFDIKGKVSLLDAISLAQGETRFASTTEVAVFRHVNGQRMGALFNVDAIRKGQAPDPQVFANDTVIVGHSKGKEMWQNIMSMNPLLGVFRVVTAVPGL
jgi:polysaccharide export outer membrane protein